MNHFSFELSLIAVLPALALCGYVFFKDRVEKEPLGLLGILFGVGAIAYIPSIFLERVILDFLDKQFADAMSVSAEGYVEFASAKTEMIYVALCSFLGFAIVRILFQWLGLFLVTHKNKNFNYLFDGVVYSVFVSLGFAVSENIYFLMQNDAELLAPKLIASVACQTLVGVVMGYYYTMWNMRFSANKIEDKLIKCGAVEKDNIKSSAPWLIACVIIPVLISGIYSFAGAVRNDIVEVIFYFIVFFVFGVSFIVINQIASNDIGYGKYLYRIIAKGHPELTAEKINEAVPVETSELKEDEVK